MNRFDHITTSEQMERPMSQGGMSMGEGGTRVTGVDHCCPESLREDGRHLVKVLSCVQSIEHFRCEYCSAEWYD